jgi:hypothetical protein
VPVWEKKALRLLQVHRITRPGGWLGFE